MQSQGEDFVKEATLAKESKDKQEVKSTEATGAKEEMKPAVTEVLRDSASEMTADTPVSSPK